MCRPENYSRPPRSPSARAGSQAPPRAPRPRSGSADGSLDLSFLDFPRSFSRFRRCGGFSCKQAAGLRTSDIKLPLAHLSGIHASRLKNAAVSPKRHDSL